MRSARIAAVCVLVAAAPALAQEPAAPEMPEYTQEQLWNRSSALGWTTLATTMAYARAVGQSVPELNRWLFELYEPGWSDQLTPFTLARGMRLNHVSDPHGTFEVLESGPELVRVRHNKPWERLFGESGELYGVSVSELESFLLGFYRDLADSRGLTLTYDDDGDRYVVTIREREDPADPEGMRSEPLDPAAEIAARIAAYLDALERADLNEARQYWTKEATLLVPGAYMERDEVLQGMAAAFERGRVDVMDRSTLDLFVHGDAAYEIARVEEVFIPDAGAADTMRNNLFVRWAKGPDGEWRFDRAVIGPQEVPATADPEEARAALLETDLEWSRVASEGADPDRIASYWSEDAVLLLPGAPPMEGREAIHDFVARNAEIPGFHVSWEPVEVVVSPDGMLGYTIGENAFTAPDAGGEMVTTPGRYVTIWRKQPDGSWKCVVDMGNSGPGWGR